MVGVAQKPDLPDTYSANVEFRVLGPVERIHNGSATPLGGPKQRAVLAILIRDAGEVVSSDALITGVWGEEASDSMRSSLHTYISNLRAAIDGRIERSGHGYRLNVAREEVDAHLFEELTDQARTALTANPAQAAQTLRAALSLWRGRPYADLVDVPGLQDEIRRLEELRLVAVEARIDADLAAGRHRALAGELESLAAENPLREGLRARHMIALYRDGRQAEALRAFQKTRQHLADELGVDPSPELREIEDQILRHDPALLSAQDVRTEEVAFLFTDVEDSTVLWETRPEEMREALARHDVILTEAITSAGGRVFKHTGDGMLAAFGSVGDAADAAVEAQRGLHEAESGSIGALKVRMSVDAGEVDSRAGDYFGPPLNRGARLMNGAHGGQIVVSAPAHEQLQHRAGLQFRNLGEHRFKGLGAPQRVYQLVVPGLADDFPDLRVDAAAPDAARQFGDAIRGYEIRERIGAGRFGVVYRAYQPSVGREVAVKVIRPEFANHPVFVRRFESEARLVAKLEHPHIVSLYDFWRDPEGAYLVMPYLAGKSLAGAPFGALPADRVVAIMRQVGSALAYAHRHGVIHRDVKPANLLLDGEGNAYVADFGVAVRSVERVTGMRPTSQVYRAPEDREGAAVDERTDVYSLAAVAAELLSGHVPPEVDLSAIPAQVRSVVEQGMEVDPGRRFATIDEFVEALAAASGAAPLPAAAIPAVTRNPFKGLAPFDESDAQDFFGRDAELAALLELVSGHRLVTVVGPSGSGKSSLARAGLVPALRSGRLPGSDDWLITTTVPGAHPFDELATALGDVATERLGDLAAELRSDQLGLLRATKQIMRDVDGELVIVIDQFEELYSLVSDDDVRTRFVDSLLAATEDPHSRIRVVATIRADFFDQPLLHDRLGEVVSTAHLALSVPGPEALLEAIERPAARAGLQFEPGLAHQIVTDVKDEPGGLPLMQFVLTALVDQAESGRVTLGDYDDAGRVTGALSRRATEVYQALAPNDQGTAQEIFLRLVSVSEDADDVRRRVRRSELESAARDPGSVDRVLGAFGTARLLTFDRDPITRGPTVEVAHEALLREWDLLRAWITERRGSLLTRRRFSFALDEWRAADESTDHLPVGVRLAEFEQLSADPVLRLSADERRFLDAAVQRREREVHERRRRRQAIMGGFAAAAVIAVVLVGAVFVQRRDAERSATFATAIELASEADRLVGLDPELSMHLALAAIDIFRQAGNAPGPAISALRAAIAQDRVVEQIPGGRFVAVHPDGSLIATADGDGVAVWDTATSQIVERYGRDGAVTNGAAFSPDGRLLAVSVEGVAPSVTVWDRTTGETFAIGGQLLPRNVNPLVFSPDGAHLAIHAHASGIEVWSIAERRLVHHVGSGHGPDFGESGQLSYVLTPDEAGASEVRVVDPATWEVSRSYPIALSSMEGFYTAWSPDETRLAVATGRRTVVVLDAVSGAEITRTTQDRVWRPEWLPDGERFVVGGEFGARVIHASNGAVAVDLRGQPRTWDYRAVPGTTLVASADLLGADTVIFDASVQGGAELGAWTAPISDVEYPVFLGDGDRLLVVGEEVYFTADSIDGGEATPPVQGGPEGTVDSPLSNADGSLVASGDADNNWAIRAAETGQVVYRAPVGWSIEGVSPDGSLALIERIETSGPDSGCSSRVVAISSSPVDVAEDLGCSGGNFEGSWTYFRSQDSTGIPVLVDSATGELQATVDLTPFNVASWQNFSITPSEVHLVAGNQDGIVYFFDLAALISGVPLDEALVSQFKAHDNFVLNVSFSPDERIAATVGFNEPLRLWDLKTGQLIEEFSGASGIAFHPTLPRFALISSPNVVSIHTLSVDELIDIAETRLSRHLTEDECQQYLRRPCDGP